MLLRLALLVFLLFPHSSRAQAAAPASAPAEQAYSDVSWPSLMRTMVRFNAFDTKDPALIDEYAIITECELYKAFYQNDFKWKQVQDAVRKSIDINIATFPTAYHYDAQMQLDRYDFSSKMFRFAPKSVINNVNTFDIYSVEGTGCGSADIKYMPRIFRAVVAVPIYIDGLPLGEKDGNDILQLMTSDHNDSRIITAQFNLRIVYIEPMRRTVDRSVSDQLLHYTQTNVPQRNLRLDARLESIDFFEDPQKTRLIYRYQP